MNSNTLSNKRTKVIFITIFASLLFFIFSNNIKSANNGTVNISVSPNQITSEGATSTTANISVSSDYPIANYLLTVTVNGEIVSSPTGLGLTEAKSHTINPVTINLAGPGNYTISVSGQISVNNGSDYVSVDVANSATVTVSAPTPQPSPTPVPSSKATSKSTTAATPKPTTKASSTKSQNNNNKNYRSINKKMIVSTDLDIRSDASLSSAYLGTFDRGTVVDVIGVTDNGWYVINYNGKTAYLAGSYLNEYSAPSSTKNNAGARSEESTSSKKDKDSKSSTTNKTEKTSKTTTSKTITSQTTTEKSDSGLLNTSDSNSTMEVDKANFKSFFSKIDPTMLVIILLSILLIILFIVYYILKRKILDDEEQEEFEEIPGDNEEVIYADKSSEIEVTRVNDSESSDD